MPRLELFAVCESCSIDQASNRLSLFNILEETNSEGLPVRVASMAIVSLWMFDPADMGREVLSRVHVRKPGGELVREFSQTFTIEARRHRLVMAVDGLALDVAGDWMFELKLDDMVAAHHTVTVNSPSRSESRT